MNSWVNNKPLLAQSDYTLPLMQEVQTGRRNVFYNALNNAYDDYKES
jgi:hypothetical protein